MLNRFSRFSLAISEIDRCWHKLAAEEMAKYGLNSPHAVYLTTLSGFKEGITAARLGELCGKNKADDPRRIGLIVKAVGRKGRLQVIGGQHIEADAVGQDEKK